METTETTEQPTPEKLPDLVINEQAKYFLHIAGRWANFLAIIGFIVTGLIFICALFIGSILARLPQFQETTMPAGVTGFMSFLYILVAVFHFFIAYYVYQFGAKIKSGIAHNDSQEAATAFGNLKSLFKLIGITTVVVLSLYILIIIIVILVAMIGLSMR